MITHRYIYIEAAVDSNPPPSHACLDVLHPLIRIGCFTCQSDVLLGQWKLPCSP